MRKRHPDRNTVWIVDSEPIAIQDIAWRDHVPEYIDKYIHKRNLKYDVVRISGNPEVAKTTIPGFTTNHPASVIYRAQQSIEIARLFMQDRVRFYDIFLFVNAWNPIVLEVKYLSELAGIRTHLHGLWHEGSYDTNSKLYNTAARKIFNKFEQSLLTTYDCNYISNEYHMQQLCTKLIVRKTAKTFKYLLKNDKILIAGWPMTYVKKYLLRNINVKKQDMIVFPHTNIKSTQLEIFKDLANALPEYIWPIAYEKSLTIEQYHSMLAASKCVFSANLHDTLGINCYEGLMHKAIPIVPDRLSYSEMYDPDFKYPSEWTKDWPSYIEHRDSMIKFIKDRVDNYDKYERKMSASINMITERYFNSEILLDKMFNKKKK